MIFTEYLLYTKRVTLLLLQSSCDAWAVGIANKHHTVTKFRLPDFCSVSDLADLARQLSVSARKALQLQVWDLGWILKNDVVVYVGPTLRSATTEPAPTPPRPSVRGVAELALGSAD